MKRIILVLFGVVAIYFAWLTMFVPYFDEWNDKEIISDYCDDNDLRPSSTSFENITGCIGFDNDKKEWFYYRVEIINGEPIIVERLYGEDVPRGY